MFLDQGELDGQQLAENVSTGSEALPLANIEPDSAGKKSGKRGRIVLVTLLVIIVVGLGYFFLFFDKGVTGVSIPPVSNLGPSSTQVTTTTTQVLFEYNATKNPFVPVGSPGVNVGSSSTPAPPVTSSTTTTTAAG